MTFPESTLRERGSLAGEPARELVSGAAVRPTADVRLRKLLRAVWSSSDFESAALTRFAQPVMRTEAQQGVFVLGTLTMLMMIGLALLYYAHHLGKAYVYTFGMLAALSGHTALSARAVSEIRVLYVLGMVLLAGCGLAFMLLAHRHGVFTATLFSTVVLLFMVVPLVPWGLREALFATGIVYSIFTASTLSASRSFNQETLWTLQLIMLTGATIALTVVARAVLIRKAQLEVRFNLTSANEELYRLSHRDSLTGALNRRFLEEEFTGIVAQHAAAAQGSYFGLIDIDSFKQLNDTYGHVCGDRVLQRLVSVLTAVLRPDDYVVRMGGDEFALLLGGSNVQGRIELALKGFTGRCDGCPELPALPRLSVGLVQLPAGVQASLEECYLSADEALYAAKEQPASCIVEGGFRGKNPG